MVGTCIYTAGLSEPVGTRATFPTQTLTNQLTLSQSGWGQIMPTRLLLAPPLWFSNLPTALYSLGTKIKEAWKGLTTMSNLFSSSLIPRTMVIVWPILTIPDTSDAQGPLPDWICIQHWRLSPKKLAVTALSMLTCNTKLEKIFNRNQINHCFFKVQVLREGHKIFALLPLIIWPY